MQKTRKRTPTSSDLLNDKFSYLVGSVLTSVKNDTVPLLYNKQEIYLGDHFIQKERTSYVIYNKAKQVVGDDLCYFLLETAMVVSFAVQHNRDTLMSEIKDLDKMYTKYYFDCVHGHKTITTLRQGNEDDNLRADSLVLKYNYAREKREYYKSKIRNLCLRNIKKR